MTRAGFEGRARVATGSAPTRWAILYRVTVAADSLCLRPAETDGVVLNVPLSRMQATPLGRAGSVVVDVDQSPLLLNFGGHQAPGPGGGSAARVRHWFDAARGRRRRGLFLRALRGGRS